MYDSTHDPSKDIAHPFFHIEAMVDPQKTKANGGVPVYYDEEFVTIRIPGMRDEINRPVEDKDRQRWPRQYEQFKKGVEQKLDGVPISEFTTASASEQATLKQMGVHTVEQCAGLGDDICQKVGFFGLKRKAVEFLKARKDIGHTAVLLAKIAELEKKIEDLESANTNAVVSGRDEGDGVQPALDVPEQPKPRRKKTGTTG